MRRTLVVPLLGLSLLLAACGGGDDSGADTTGQAAGPSSSIGAAASSTTAAPKEDGPGCKALKGYQNADLIALRVLRDGTVDENRDQVVTGLNNTQARVDEVFPDFSADVAALRTRTQTLLDGGEPTPEQQAAADAATQRINGYKSKNCVPPPAGSAKDLPPEAGPQAAEQSGDEPAAASSSTSTTRP